MKTTLLKSAGLMLALMVSQIANVSIAQSNQSRNNTSTISFSQNVKTTTPIRTIHESDENKMEVEYNFSSLSKTQTTRNSKTFDFLHIDGFAKMGEIGNPALPAHNDIVLIPSTGAVTITYTAGDYVEFDGYTIFPALEPASDQEGKPEPEFVQNLDVYQQNAFFPQTLVFISAIQKVREQQIAIVQIRPIQFNPITHKIRVYKNIKYQLNYTGEKIGFSQMSAKNSQRYLNTIKNSYINGNIIPKNSTAKSSTIDYLIITTTALKPAADSLALWKIQLGYTPIVIAKSSWTAAQVKDTIHNRYTNCAVHPDYFVIIGDHEQVPSEVLYYSPTQNYATDLYYACMDGEDDYIPEMARGRISVTSDTMAMTVVKKIINYERNPVNDPTFYNSAVTCSYFQDGTNYTSYMDGYDDRRFVQTSEEIRTYLMSKGYVVNRVYEAFDNRTPLKYNNGYYSNGENLPSDLLKSNGFQWNGGTFDVIGNINAGKFLVMHRDHGYIGGYGWAHPQLVNIYQHINIMANGNKLPVVFSLNCYTGDFLQAECFAENFLRKNDGGAVGIFAHTCESYSGYNDALAIGLMDAIWASPGLTGVYGFGAGTTNPVLNAHNNIRTMGDVLNQGLIRMMATWTSPVKWKLQHEIFQYFGDPTMRMWTQNPTEIIANIPDLLPRMTTNLVVTSSTCTDGMVTLVVNGELIAKTYLVNGTVTIPINYQTTVDAFLTISKENYRPYVKKITIRNEYASTKPTMQAHGIALSSNISKSTSTVITWENGDGDSRLVMMNLTNNFTTPIDGQEYVGDNNYQGNGEQIIYVGQENSVLVNGLDENLTYWYRVYEFNNEGVFTLYQTVETVNNPASPKADGGVLPINLLSFEGKKFGNAIQLTWKTADEINNDFFTIEKSNNSKDFEVFKTISATKNQTNINTYELLDENPNDGINYYRLKQTDFDGKVTTFKTISVNSNSVENFEIQQVQSSGASTNIYFSMDENSQVNVKLVDLEGKIIFEQIVYNENESINKLNIQNTNLTSGLYLVSFETSNMRKTSKLIIQ